MNKHRAPQLGGSLASSLDFLLSLPFQILALTEVRASWSGAKAMSRVAARAGFAAIWSASPPLSYISGRGGTALLVKQPLSLTSLRSPCLERWFLEARVCVGGRSQMCLACDLWLL